MKRPNCTMKCKLWNKQQGFRDKKKEAIIIEEVIITEKEIITKPLKKMLRKWDSISKKDHLDFKTKRRKKL